MARTRAESSGVAAHASEVRPRMHEGEPLRALAATYTALRRAVSGLGDADMAWVPEPGKWPIGAILQHLADNELIVAVRIRLILAEDGPTIQAYDQDAWARTFQYAESELRGALRLFRTVRQANLELLDQAPPDQWQRRGIHTARGEVTLAQYVAQVAEHDRNHLAQIRRIRSLLRKGARRP